MLRYLFFKFLSGFGYAVTIFLFYPNKDILSSIYLILIQEFIFSFFLTHYRINVVSKRSRIPKKQILVLSGIGFILTIFFMPSDNLSYGVFLLCSMIIYPYYLIEASDYESKSFKNAIKLENLLAPLSVLLFFTISLFLFLFKLNWSGLIFSRFFIFFSLSILVIKNKKKSLELIINKSAEIKISLINTHLLLIISFFILKVILMKNGLTKTDDIGIEGKLYLLVYDVIAAIYGFSLRYFIFQKTLEKDKFKKILVLLSISCLIIISIFFFIDIPIDMLTKQTIYISFFLAASYGLFCLISNNSLIILGIILTCFCSYLITISGLFLSGFVMTLGFFSLFLLSLKFNLFNSKLD